MQLIQHLGMEDFLEVTAKAQPNEQFKRGNMGIAMLQDRYATEGRAVPPERSWCMTLGALDSLQVSYQPRPSDAQLKAPCMPFQCCGVDEAVKEHLARCTVQDVLPASPASGGLVSCLAALTAAAAAGQRAGAPPASTVTQYPTEQSRPTLASPHTRADSIEFQQTADNEAAACDGGGVPSGTHPPSCCDMGSDSMPSGLDNRPCIAAMLASADAASAQGRSTESVQVDGQVLAGTVDMTEAAIAQAARQDNRQCRMM